MDGIEINMVVTDSLSAIKLYEQIFILDIIQRTDLKKGENEVIFSIHETRFHMLDENHANNLYAPKQDAIPSVSFNVYVTDLDAVFDNIVQEGCTIIQPITQNNKYGLSSAIIKDKFGYVWMLHEELKNITHNFMDN